MTGLRGRKSGLLDNNMRGWQGLVNVIKVLLDETEKTREASQNLKWMPRSFRYILEDFAKHCDPSRVVPKLIPVSAEAAKKIESRGGWSYHQKVGLTYEHAVPLRTLFDLLMECRESKKDIEASIKKFFFVTWVTDEEDSRLNQLGLRSKMPDGWNPEASPHARYHAAGIEVLT